MSSSSAENTFQNPTLEVIYLSNTKSIKYLVEVSFQEMATRTKLLTLYVDISTIAVYFQKPMKLISYN